MLLPTFPPNYSRKFYKIPASNQKNKTKPINSVSSQKKNNQNSVKASNQATIVDRAFLETEELELLQVPAEEPERIRKTFEDYGVCIVPWTPSRELEKKTAKNGGKTAVIAVWGYENPLKKPLFLLRQCQH